MRKNKNKSSCSWIFWIIVIILAWSYLSSDNGKDSSSRSSSTNNVRNSNVSFEAKASSNASSRNMKTNAVVSPTVSKVKSAVSTPVPTYMIFNSKDINGAPFYAEPVNSADLLIYSLRNETKIKITGKMISNNNYDWYPIRDDRGKDGWVQAMYVTDTNHVSVPAKSPVRRQSPTKTPVPQRYTTVITWTCYDVTSIDYDWNNDNLCISSNGERRYVGDSEARRLDPNYWPR